MSAVPEAEINRQVALKNDFNAHGFKALSATGIVVCTILVGLRLWSRRWQKIGWKADDYVIMLAWVCRSAPFDSSDVNEFPANMRLQALMVPYSAIFYSMGRSPNEHGFCGILDVCLRDRNSELIRSGTSLVDQTHADNGRLP